MSDHDDGIDDARADGIATNIDLAFRFLGEAFDDPSRLDEIPSGTALVVLPADDPETTAANLALAGRLSEEGRDVRMHRLGAAPGERSALAYRTVRPRWPTEGIDPVAEYDRATDTLFVDFFNGRRRGIDIPTRDLGLLFVDRNTEEVIANLVPDFLSRVVPRDPSLIDVLLRPETTLHGITRDEVREVRAALGHRDPGPDAPPATFAAIAERLELLTA